MTLKEVFMKIGMEEVSPRGDYSSLENLITEKQMLQQILKLAGDARSGAMNAISTYPTPVLLLRSMATNGTRTIKRMINERPTCSRRKV